MNKKKQSKKPPAAAKPKSVLQRALAAAERVADAAKGQLRVAKSPNER